MPAGLISLRRSIRAVFMRYCMTGGIGTAAQYVVLVCGVRLFEMPVVSSSVGAIVGAVLNYFINYHYTFESSRPHLATMHRFFWVALVSFFLNAAIMSFCIHTMTMHYLLAQVLSTGLVVLWGFGANLVWTFR